MHARARIRDAIVLELQGIAATVQADRIWILQVDELPLVGVYTDSEAQTLDAEGASFDAIDRVLDVSCDVAVVRDDGAASMNALDVLAGQIETALGANRNLLGIMDIVPAEMEVTQSSEGDQIVSRMVLTFAVMYRTAIGAPEVII